MSKAKILSSKLGGEWKYIAGMCGWESSDGRRVIRTATCTCDSPCGCGAEYIYYQDGKQAHSLGRFLALDEIREKPNEDWTDWV